jgi:hypothetical protein
VRVLSKSRLVDVAALRSAARGRPRAEIETEPEVAGGAEPAGDATAPAVSETPPG